MDVMSKPDHPAPSLHPLPPFNPNFIPPLPLPSSQRLAPAPQTLHFPPYQFPSAPRPVNASAVEVKPTFNPLAGQTQIPHLPSPTPQSTNETIQTEPNPVRYSLTSFYNPSAPTTQVVPSLPLSQDNPPIPPSFNYQLISAAFSSTFNSSSGSTYQYPPAFTMSDTPTKRGKWTPAEDAMLKQIVAESGPDGVKDWLLVSKKIPNRSHKQCRERWTNHLDPLIKKESWTEDEKCQLVRSWFRYGNQWSRIAVDLPGRSQNDIKNRMYSILRYWNTQEARHKTAKYFDQEELAAATGKVNKKGDGIGIKDIVEQIIRSGRNIPAVFFPKGGMSRPGSLSEVGFGLGLTLRGHTRQIMADGTETQQSEIDHDPSRERRIREKRKKRKKDELLDEYVGLDEIDEELEWIAKQKRELESDEESSKSSERTPVKLPPKLPVSIAKPKPQLKVDPVVEIKVEDDLLDDSLFDSDTPSQSDKDTPLAPPIPTSITPQPTKRTKRSTPLPRREPSQRRVTSTPSTPASDKRKTELVNESPFMSGKRSIRKSSWLLNDYVIPQQKPRKKRKKPKNKQKLIVVKTEPMDVQSDVFLADFGFSESSHSTEDDIDQSELPALPEATPVPARMTRGQKKKMKEDEQHTPTRNRLVSHNSLVDTPISQRSERIERMDQNDPERITTPVNPSRITQPALSPFSLGTMTHSPGHAREGEKLEHDVLTSINTPLHNRMIDEKIEGPSGNVDSRLHDVKSKMAKKIFTSLHTLASQHPKHRKWVGPVLRITNDGNEHDCVRSEDKENVTKRTGVVQSKIRAAEASE
ncbi:putative Transcriptional activator Myb [Blattamonas nauphoetae]|uniref:Transcriptional activator Myb n=1 Tax=Blattamonas nauphoetae TaxID=2049346 RepID=A0ABQ9XIU2_9EUKA|nr:putative Transcriptional activator Myb [Blattamonas nauphoetae]